MVSPRSAATGGALGFRGSVAMRQGAQNAAGGVVVENSSSNNIPLHHPQAAARRGGGGRYMNLSRDDSSIGGGDDSEMGSEFLYTVHIPSTPDHQLMSATPSVRSMDPGIAVKAEQQFVSSTIFTGGFNSVTRGHVMEKMMEGEESNHHHPQLACARGATCSVEGCDSKAMRDERGEDMTPCDCQFKICRDCYIDALNSSGKCPGCKEEYKILDEEEQPMMMISNGTHHQNGGGTDSSTDIRALPPPPSSSSDDGTNKNLERRLSLLKAQPGGLLMSSQSSDFDHTRWLYQTKGTYGYGNAVWPKDDGYTTTSGNNNNNNNNSAPHLGSQPDFNDKSRRPLSRKASISPGILSPYR